MELKEELEEIERIVREHKEEIPTNILNAIKNKMLACKKIQYFADNLTQENCDIAQALAVLYLD